MRIKKDKEDISYSKVSQFFKNRMTKFKEDNPYSLTMYQDNNPELVKARNEKEVSILLPKLELDKESRVLDIACGIGRWSDAINAEINEYCGVDFCEDFINLAQKRNENNPNRHFYVSRSENTAQVVTANGKKEFNRILFIGCFVYLNDEDVIRTLRTIEPVCHRKSIICIREPIGLAERLTLKEQFSEELKDCYNAIYRTRDELVEYFQNTLLNKGFYIAEESFLFKNAELNNRKETSQYFFILKRDD